MLSIFERSKSYLMSSHRIYHYAHTFFRHENYITDYLKSIGKHSPHKLVIADVGCGPNQPFKELIVKQKNIYVGFDIFEGPNHVHFDGLKIPAADASFDIVLCTEVFEHAADWDSLFQECIRILRNNGLLILTVPFMYPAHGLPSDYRRFTIEGMKSSFRENRLNFLEEKRFGGISSFLPFILIDFRERFLRPKSNIASLFSILIIPIFLAMSLTANLLSLAIQRIENRDLIYSNFVMIGTKNLID